MTDLNNQEVGSPSHIADFVELNARNTPDKTALVHNDHSITWSSLWREVEQKGTNLATELGDDHQEVVALLFPNCIDYIIAYLAVLYAGHIAMPIDVIYKPLEINAILGQIPPKLIITDEVNAGRINYAAAPLWTYSQLNEKRPSKDQNRLKLPADRQIASLVFTSGTTGKPKAAPYTHANHIWNIKVSSKVWNWTSEDTLLISLRLSHWYGLVMGLSGAIYHGNTMYLQDRFDPESTLETLASGKISLFTHTPATFAKMLTVEGEHDLSAVRLPISGSAPLPPAVWKKFKNRFGAEIIEAYGSSETGRIAANLPDERIPGSPGRILPEVSVKFSDNGELLVKSPGVFPGYFNNPEATTAALLDGWWRTGDIGELKDGRLILRGRRQEIIRKHGYTVSPRDIEWAVHQNSSVKEVYVMGRQQPGDFNDQIVYFVAGDLDKEELLAFCKENLPSVWRPDQVVLLDRLPRTPNGKPKLTELRAMVN